MTLEILQVIINGGVLVALISGLLKLGRILERLENHDRALRKAGLIPLVFIFCLVIHGCGPKRVEMGEPYVNGDYGYMKVGEQYHVVVRSAEGYARAKREICGTHICTWERVGDIYFVDVAP